MTDAIVPQVTPNAVLANAQNYQTFEMAKSNDTILGSDDIAQIRTYAAKMRAQAQYLHKTIAATSGLEDVAAIKAEAIETEQTFAKISVYADQRIGEILRELPKSNKWASNSDTQEVETKADALKESGISKSQAYDLQAMAANPEVVEAVIAKATEEGRIVSRKQVLDAIKQQKQAEQQRDEARQEMQDVYLQAENMELEVERLKDQLKSRPQHEVVREVESEEAKRRIKSLEHEVGVYLDTDQKLRRQLEETRKELDRAKGILNMGESARKVQNDVEYLIAATNQYVRNYGGLTWTFEQIADVDETTREELRKAVKNLATFSNALVAGLEQM